jgi:FkbM family methyltransferase
MRILFILKQMGYVRHFDTVVRDLANRGHSVRLAAQDGVTKLPPELEGRSQITATRAPSKRGDDWKNYASLVRRAGDYLRYLTPPFRSALKLRARAFEKLVQTLSNGSRETEPGFSDAALGLTDDEIDRLTALIQMIEKTIPPDQSLVDFIAKESPDLLLITPLIDIGSGQTDFIKAARKVGIPSAMALFSWDNLSTKGAIHEFPDAVFVWNEIQKKEAIDFHHVPKDRIVVTGATRFDTFFKLKSVIERDEFCRKLGLDAEKPIITYLGSSKFVSEREEEFIEQWIRAVRSTPDLKQVNILIKTHPDLNRRWNKAGERIAWETRGGTLRLRKDKPFNFPRVVAVRTPFSAAQLLYECVFHSSAVVGLNTSAELEAGIVGRPVLTITVPDDYADGQQSTLHFRYLLDSEGGYVQTAPNLDTHCTQLTRSVTGDYDRQRLSEFIQKFVRPKGLDRSATGEMARAIGRLVKRKPKSSLNSSQTVEIAAPSTETSVNNVLETEVLDYAPVQIRLIATSVSERKWRTKTCGKEPWTIEWLEKYVRSGTVLYDIGANVGPFTLIAAMRAPDVRVVAFEPGYASFAHLCDNLILNQVADAVIPVPMPLWSQTGMMNFKYRSTEPGESRHAMRQYGPLRGRSGTRHVQPVFAYRLDDLVEKFNLPAPTHLKLDVDGAEVDVLSGAEQTLKTPGLESLLVEYEEALAEQVKALLGAAGFGLAKQIQRSKLTAPLYAEFRRGVNENSR